MNKAVIVIISIIILFSIVTALYIFIELPQQQKHLSYHNLSIGVYDLDNQFIVTNYSIYYDNIYQKSGITSNQGYVKEEVLINKTIQILIENDNYYSQIKTFNDKVDNATSLRADFFPREIGSLTLRHEGQFFIDNPLKLEVIADGYVQNLITCFKWEKGIINVYIPNKTIIEKPTRVKVDKCYDLNVTLQDESYIFDIEYKKFLGFNNNQLLVYIFDKQLTSESINIMNYSKNNNDIGSKDVIYILDNK